MSGWGPTPGARGPKDSILLWLLKPQSWSLFETAKTGQKWEGLAPLPGKESRAEGWGEVEGGGEGVLRSWGVSVPLVLHVGLSLFSS